MIQIETKDAVKAWLSAAPPKPASFHSLDLTDFDAAFSQASVEGCLFLGCTIGGKLAERIAVEKAGIISELSVLPATLPAFAPGIYTVADLYEGMQDDGSDWEKTPDHAGYLFFNEKKNKPNRLSPIQMMAARIHDTVQQQAVDEYLNGKQVVAIMGGHDFKRMLTADEKLAGKADVYWECVAIAKALTEEGFLILTGGGPGLMEAGNLGALLANADEQTVQQVRAIMTNQDFEKSGWRASAIEARRIILGDWKKQPPPKQFSLGVPTWLYGHEPPNLFAGYQSKMFYNSLREDGLVTLANSGIIYFEGNAGTVQEIFQDATQNYYLGEGQLPTPMVFYNSGGYWDRACNDLSWPTDSPMDKRKPVLPLIKQLAIEKGFSNAVLVSDDPAAVVKFLVDTRKKQPIKKTDVKGVSEAQRHAMFELFLDTKKKLLNTTDEKEAAYLNAFVKDIYSNIIELGWKDSDIRAYALTRQLP
ncbi:putative Rossmann-fold nucleotide-binding protein [Pseudoxanthomonas japonensis]|uniref:LOG family protein n=1 Tax=Pseudoxanthomonas japonensis TaxID=69284 RepID=UPI00285C9AD7|nr:hypothetical protein [Pseudoxanthomonas japonensis]MDR7069806.1 putative Rossmann-fold nucleotide-binding protein [Pseudoxanthomonas japonensis]